MLKKGPTRPQKLLHTSEETNNNRISKSEVALNVLFFIAKRYFSTFGINKVKEKHELTNVG